MAGTRRGLGRGLEALIPSTPAEAEAAGLEPVTGASFSELPVTAIKPNARQPRTVFDEDELGELVHSPGTRQACVQVSHENSETEQHGTHRSPQPCVDPSDAADDRHT